MKFRMVVALLLTAVAVVAEEFNPLNAVVKVETRSSRPNFWQPWQNLAQSGCAGSGVVIAGNKILTNSHNVADATFITVRKQNSDMPEVAKVVAVNHECDLALLEVGNPEFFKDVKPFEIGETPELRTTVYVAGYPMGGEGISITQGVISRIEIQSYAQSNMDHLAVQLDAAINPGNSGGPVLYGGKVVGIAFQGYDGGDGLGYMIPTQIINHFLKDASDGKITGFGKIGVVYSFLENPDTRRFLKMSKEQTGIRVCHIHSAMKNSPLKVDDVIMAIDGKKISNDGNVHMPNGENRFYTVFVDEKQIGETLKLTVLRDGKTLELTCEVQKIVPMVKPFQYDKIPNYYITGGLVFTELSDDYVVGFGKRNPPVDLTIPYGVERTDPEKDIIVCTTVLADEVNVGYQYFRHQVLNKVDGKEVRNLRELVDAVEKGQGEFVTFAFGQFYQVTLDRKKVIESTPRILQRYRIPADRRLSQK